MKKILNCEASRSGITTEETNKEIHDMIDRITNIKEAKEAINIIMNSWKNKLKK